jgi:hypothetical protein
VAELVFLVVGPYQGVGINGWHYVALSTSRWVYIRTCPYSLNYLRPGARQQLLFTHLHLEESLKMKSLATIAPLLLQVGQVSAAAISQRTSSLQWGPCELREETELPVECAKLPVPLDYTNETAGTIDLDLIRVQALKQPSRGSILLNFGGPGQDGLNSMTAYYPVQGP